MVTTQPFTVLIVFLILTICSHQLLTEHQNGDHSKIYPDKRDSLSASSLAQLSPSTSVSSSLQSLSPTRGRNCSSCMLLDDAKQRRIRSIKWQILNKLGFKNEPNITRRDNLEVPPLKDIIASSPIPLSPLSSLSTFSSPSSYHSSDPTIQYDTKRLHEMYSKDELMSSDQAYPNSEDYDDDSEDFYVNTDKAISFAMKPKNFDRFDRPRPYFCLIVTLKSKLKDGPTKFYQILSEKKKNKKRRRKEANVK